MSFIKQIWKFGACKQIESSFMDDSVNIIIADVDGIITAPT